MTRDNGEGRAERRYPGYPPPSEQNGRMLRSALLGARPRNGRPEYMKELNLLIVLEIFRASGAMSRADIVRLTGISAPTVSKIVEWLTDARLLLTQGSGVSTGGKRPTMLRFNPRYGQVLGIDLGGTHLRVAVANLDGAIIHRTVAEIDAGAGPDAILARIVQAGRAALAACGSDGPLAVTLATPGVVNVDQGVVVAARNLHGWKNVRVRQALEDGFGVPVAIDNDVNLAAVGERWHGAAQGHDDVVFISIGTGIGAGILVRGQVHRGHAYAAGEINTLPSGYPAESGDGEAWLEDVASGPAIVRRARARGLCAASAVLTTAAVFAAARAGDPIAAQVTDEAIGALARGVAALTAAIDPSVVVIGGGVSRQGAALIDPLRERVRALSRLRADLLRSELDVDAQLHGTVFTALHLADERLAALVRGE